MPSVLEEDRHRGRRRFVDADAEEGGGALKEEGHAISLAVPVAAREGGCGSGQARRLRDATRGVRRTDVVNASGNVADLGLGSLRRDLESRTWRVYARVGEVRGARCSVPIVIKSQVVLEVGAKISFENTTTTSTKTTRKLDSLAKFTRPRVKDYATDGADFNGERLVVAACVPRSSAHLRVSVYERLKTDLVKTRRLGIATIPLDEVPVLSAPLTGVSRRSVGAFLSNLRSPSDISRRDLVWILKSLLHASTRALRRRSTLLDRSYYWRATTARLLPQDRRARAGVVHWKVRGRRGRPKSASSLPEMML